GLYLIIKKQYPKFVTKNKLRLLILLLGGLLLTHIYLLETELIQNSNQNIISLTRENFVSYINGTVRGTLTAGGMIGALLLTLTFYLFTGIGAKISGYFMLVIGILIITEISLVDLFKKYYESFLLLITKTKTFYLEKKKQKKPKQIEQAQEKLDNQKKIGRAHV